MLLSFSFLREPIYTSQHTIGSVYSRILLIWLNRYKIAIGVDFLSFDQTDNWGIFESFKMNQSALINGYIVLYKIDHIPMNTCHCFVGETQKLLL